MNVALKDFLKEDLGKGDITTKALIGKERAIAVIFAKQDCVLAGLEEASRIFGLLGLKSSTAFVDGQRVHEGDQVLRVEGPAKSILVGERVALNFLMRMSGIATQTRDLVERCKKINPDVEVAATRKTTPGFRYYEKKAVTLGGGNPHRFRLDSEYLIKDNHLVIVESVGKAVRKAKEKAKGRKVEVEVKTEEEAIEAANSGADIIMLDNMSPETGAEVAKRVREICKAKIEASGGITPSNIEEYATYADMISLGWLTHSLRSMDFSLKIIEKVT
ncbi:MAG: carboxylating nicotinate-nucleotide diphosphorylase [Methanobacteriota archaeon]|nr:MAG: carboxylating nicotinate-nucleotide diphosphorylase [Euryarchaeota archaeon]